MGDSSDLWLISQTPPQQKSRGREEEDSFESDSESESDLDLDLSQEDLDAFRQRYTQAEDDDCKVEYGLDFSQKTDGEESDI